MESSNIMQDDSIFRKVRTKKGIKILDAEGKIEFGDGTTQNSAATAAGLISTDASNVIELGTDDKLSVGPLHWANLYPSFQDKSFVIFDLVVGDNTIPLPTIPSGYKLYCPDITGISNTGDNVTTHTRVVRGGVEHTVQNGTGAIVGGIFVVGVVSLSPGDSLKINAGGSCNVLVRCFLVPDNGNLKMGMLEFSTAAMSNIYTCPAGKKAIPFTYPAQGGFTRLFSVMFSNNAGASRTFSLYQNATRLLRAATTLNDAAFGGSVAVHTVLTAGETLDVQASGTGTFAVLYTIYEIDA